MENRKGIVEKSKWATRKGEKNGGARDRMAVVWDIFVYSSNARFKKQAGRAVGVSFVWNFGIWTESVFMVTIRNFYLLVGTFKRKLFRVGTFVIRKILPR